MKRNSSRKRCQGGTEAHSTHKRLESVNSERGRDRVNGSANYIVVDLRGRPTHPEANRAGISKGPTPVGFRGESVLGSEVYKGSGGTRPSDGRLA